MKKNMTNCESCGGEIAVSAKSCPQCGAKVNRPVTKKWWFWAIIVVVVLGIIGGVSGSNSESKHRLTRAHREKQLKMSCQALHNAPPNRT